MKVFSRIITVLCSVVLLFSLCGCEENTVKIPSPTERFYINDFAGVMESEDADAVFSIGAELDKSVATHTGAQVGAQVVAVTVNTTDGKEIGEYALELGRQWGIGNSDENNGVVILLATDDREVYVAVGYGLEGALPDSKTGRIIDNYAIEYFAENEFSGGMLNLYKAIVREVYSEYGLSVPNEVSLPDKYRRDIDLKDVGMSWAVIAIIIIFCIIYFGAHGFFLPVGPVYRGFWDGFGGGSGRGGFGGFSGGGGGFGGGGAGRGF